MCGHSALPHEKIPGLVNGRQEFTDSPATAGLRYFFHGRLRAQLRAELHAQVDGFHRLLQRVGAHFGIVTGECAILEDGVIEQVGGRHRDFQPRIRKRLAEILQSDRGILLLLGCFLDALIDGAVVDVRDVLDLGVRQTGQTLDVSDAAAVGTDNRDGNLVVGSDLPRLRGSLGEETARARHA